MQFVTNPWDHQRKLVDVCANRENYALFWDMGTGKSKGIIDVLRYKYNKHGRHLRTVIIGPPVVIENWVREFKIHSKIKRVFGLKGKVAERLKIAKHVFADHGDTGCTFITNYEALQNEEFRLWLYNKFRPEVVVLDEAHYIKNGESRRTKHCVKLGKTAMYRFILTGTPILKSPLDLFYLYKFLDQGESFGTAITAFRAKYFLDANALIEAKPYKDWVFRDEFRQEIIERIEAKSMYVSKKECLDLPDLIIQTVDIGMMPEQTKAYKDMKKDFVAYILDQRDNLLKPAVATLAVTKALRLMQIASGFCNVEGGDCVVFKNNPRLLQLKEDLLQLTPDHKVIIWAVFKENYKAIREVLESIGLVDAFVEVHGKIPQKAREAGIDRFNTDPTCRVFLGHPKSGGIGINLVASDYTIRFSKDFNLGDYLQSRDRNHRGGSEIHEKITHREYVAEDTIEETITKALIDKNEISLGILVGLAEDSL